MGANPSPMLPFLYVFVLLSPSLLAFQSDELLADDEAFGLEGALKQPDPNQQHPVKFSSPPLLLTKRKFPDPDTDSKVQFVLEHAFGDSDFSPAGTFSARIKTWSHGGQTLTKLRFSRDAFSEFDKKIFKKLLQDDAFYRIRLPSNVLSPPGKDYVISSVKARCLPRGSIDELFVIHMEGVNILAVNYGSPGACQYPRQLKLPASWSFNSHTVLKTSDQAPRTPLFTEERLGGNIDEGELIKPPERSFWAKYWMYVIPLGLIVMNAVTQAMNMPEEQAAGQAATLQRGPSPAVRRR